VPNLGPTELIIILVIVVAIFGAGKLANLGGALGKGVKDFRSAVREGREEDQPEEPVSPASAAPAKAESEPEDS
jgi:sec-independent protein translocase protein TatA